MQRKDAAACLSVNPARSINLLDRGELKPGKLADISFFNTETNNARLTVSKGKESFQR
jgi:N-acetylglucosamine-6-phosphate deacetylase